jgi:hypothetical protein
MEDAIRTLLGIASSGAAEGVPRGEVNPTFSNQN